jgi:hypothetical protein
MIDMCSEKVDPTSRADYKDTAICRVPIGKCFEGTLTHHSRFGFQIVIITIDLMQFFMKGAFCIFNQLNPATDWLQTTDIRRHNFLSSKMFPNFSLSGMIGDLQPARQEKSPAFVGEY